MVKIVLIVCAEIVYIYLFYLFIFKEKIMLYLPFPAIKVFIYSAALTENSHANFLKNNSFKSSYK